MPSFGWRLCCREASWTGDGTQQTGGNGAINRSLLCATFVAFWLLGYSLMLVGLLLESPPLLHKLPNALFSILVTILKSSSHIHTFRGHLPKGRWKKPKFCEKLFKWKLVMKKNYLEHMIYAESIASILAILVSIVVILTNIEPVLENCVHLQVQYSRVLWKF